MSVAALPRRVEITKGSDGFGFNLSKAEGRHYLRLVDKGGAAHVAGARSGDRILAVNDVSVVHKNHKELVAFIRAGGDKLAMILLASEFQMPIPPSAKSVTITRGNDGFGFNLGRKGHNHFFKAVDNGGPTQIAGASAGDIIFEVNGVSVTGLTHGDVVKLIKAGGTTVQMKIENPAFLTEVQQQQPTHSPNSAGLSAAQAMNTLAQARVRAEQAIIMRREQERMIHEQKIHEQKIQLIQDELASLDKGIQVAGDKLKFIQDQTIVQRTKTQRFANKAEFKELDDNLLLIEQEAINELNAKQETLPYPSENAGSIEMGRVQIAIKSWELEVAVTRQELAQSRLDEMIKLMDIAQNRRKSERDETEQEVAAITKRREKDMVTIEQRRKRFEAQLEEARKKKDAELARAKAARERKEQEMRDEEQRRQQLAAEVNKKLALENEPLSFKEESRRKLEQEELEYLKKDQERLQKLADAKKKLAEAEEAEQEEARLKNASSIFGVRMKKAGQDFVDHEEKRSIHPLVSMMGENKSKGGGLTHLCKPPDTRL